MGREGEMTAVMSTAKTPKHLLPPYVELHVLGTLELYIAAAT